MQSGGAFLPVLCLRAFFGQSPAVPRSAWKLREVRQECLRGSGGLGRRSLKPARGQGGCSMTAWGRHGEHVGRNGLRNVTAVPSDLSPGGLCAREVSWVWKKEADQQRYPSSSSLPGTHSRKTHRCGRVIWAFNGSCKAEWGSCKAGRCGRLGRAGQQQRAAPWGSAPAIQKAKSRD